MNLSDIADEIFTELSEPSDISQASIIYWLYTNIGGLNSLLERAFETTASVITPSPSEIEKQILKKLYFLYFYGRQMNRNLGAAALVLVASVTEGNRTVRRFDRTNVARNYKSLIDDIKDELHIAVLAYKMGAATPAQFIVQNPILTETNLLVRSLGSGIYYNPNV